MKSLILLVLPLFLLTACAPTHYAWKHEGGFGDAELKEAQGVCLLYAEEQTPPIHYRGYPYYYVGHRYYGGHRHHYRSHFYGHHNYYRQGYYGGYGGYNTYAYQEDISRACMKGKGWNRIKIEEG